MSEAQPEYRSVTLRENDLQDLNEIARREFGTDDVSVRTVVRRLIAQADGGDDA